MNIIERLKKAQIERNLSVYKLSQISEVSKTHIRDLEDHDCSSKINSKKY